MQKRQWHLPAPISASSWQPCPGPSDRCASAPPRAAPAAPRAAAAAAEQTLGAGRCARGRARATETRQRECGARREAEMYAVRAAACAAWRSGVAGCARAAYAP
jgi:hypothetical protein